MPYAVARRSFAPVIPMPRYLRRRGMGDAACGPNSFQDPANPWLTDGSGNPSSTPHCVMNQYWGRVLTQAGLDPNSPFIGNGNLPPGFNPAVPAVPGAVSVSSWWNNPSQGGCPVIDMSANSCGGVDPNTGAFIITPCNDYRECDSLTGVSHSISPGPQGSAGVPTQNYVPPANAAPTGTWSADMASLFAGKNPNALPGSTLPTQAGQVLTSCPSGFVLNNGQCQLPGVAAAQQPPTVVVNSASGAGQGGGNTSNGPNAATSGSGTGSSNAPNPTVMSLPLSGSTLIWLAVGLGAVILLPQLKGRH